MEYWGYLFGEKDIVVIEEISKNLNVPKEIAEKHYKVMVENIKNEVHNKA